MDVVLTRGGGKELVGGGEVGEAQTWSRDVRCSGGAAAEEQDGWSRVESQEQGHSISKVSSEYKLERRHGNHATSQHMHNTNVILVKAVGAYK
eukprot:3321204-Rhodomonas_salina.1